MKIEMLRWTDRTTGGPIDSGTCIVVREDGEKTIRESGWTKQYGGDPNSNFFYQIVQALKEKGYDVIKKRMWRDGHMTDSDRQYIRTRKVKGNETFCLTDPQSYVKPAFETYNEDGKVTLEVTYNLGEV